MEYGTYLFGRFCGCEDRKSAANGKEAVSTVIGVATGLRSVAVYCDGKVDCSALKWGDEILVQCRAYVGRNGALGFSGGKIVDPVW